MGATVSFSTDNPEEMLEQMRQSILNAFPNLQPDSLATMHNRQTKETRTYQIILVGPDENITVNFVEVQKPEVNSATECAIAVTNIYGQHDKLWEGCIHYG